MKTTIPQAVPRLPSLDGWRALSILAVLGSHTIRVPDFPPALGPVFTWTFDGDLGVRMFFVISGFLITWLMLLEHDRTGGVSLRHFYARRALRILPVYFAFLGVLFALQCFTGFRPTGVSWLSSLTFTTNFTHHGHWIIGHLWSLAVEEQFYVLWPCLFVLLGCGRDLSRCLWVLGAPLCIAPFARVLAYLDVAPTWLSVLFTSKSFFCYFDSLAIGCISAVLFARRPDEVRRWINCRPRLLCLTGVALIAVPHVLSTLLKFGIYTIPLGFTCQGLGLALLLLQSLVAPRAGLYPALNWGVVSLIGVLSYSIYIWQQIFCTEPGAFGIAPTWWLSFPGWVVSALVVATCSYFGLERPLFRLRAHFRS